MMLERLRGLFAGMGLAASLALAAPSTGQASTMITVTSTGTISFGVDFAGLITGTPNTKLDDKTASIVIQYKFNPMTIPLVTSQVASVFFLDVTATVSVIDYDYTITFATSQGAGTYTLTRNTLLNGLSADFFIVEPFEDFGPSSLSGTVLFQDPSFHFNTLFDEFDLTTAPSSGFWGFGVSLTAPSPGSESWVFTVRPDRVTVTVEHVAVPAPAAIGIFLVGLAGLAAARRTL